MSDKIKKQLYHSELSGMGSVLVEVLSGVLQSKFDKEKAYVEMRIDGNLRHYVIENETCKSRLANMKGRKVMLKAIGSRDEADIEVAGATAPREQQEAPQTKEREPDREPAPQGRPPSHGNDTENLTVIKQEANRIANLYLVAHEAAKYVVKQMVALDQNQKPLTIEAEERVATTLFIQLCRNGKDGLMPTGAYTDLKKK